MYVAAMAYSDQILLDAIRLRTNSQTPLLLHEIADEIDMPKRTADRAMRRLLRDGRIRRYGRGRRWGYTYEVVDDTACS